MHHRALLQKQCFATGSDRGTGTPHPHGSLEHRTWVRGRSETKTYGKGVTIREHKERQTLPRKSFFGKDIDERSRAFNALQALSSPTDMLLSGKLLCTAIGSCTCTLRINTTGSPVDLLRVKKTYERGLSGYPSGPLTSADALAAGRADTRRLLRPSSLAASDHRACSHPRWLWPRGYAKE